MKQILKSQTFLSALILVLVACSPGVTKLDPADLPPFLCAEEGAFKIKASLQYGSTFLSYRLQVPFAADKPVSAFSDRLEAAGFVELPFHWSDADSPSSRVDGWSTWNQDGTFSKVGVHDWQVSWVRADGSMVMYELQYRGEPHEGRRFEPPSSDILEVSAVFWPNSVTIRRCPHVLEWRDGLASDSEEQDQ